MNKKIANICYENTRSDAHEKQTNWLRKQAVMDVASKVIKSVIHTNTYSVEAVNNEARYNTGQWCSIKQMNKSLRNLKYFSFFMQMVNKICNMKNVSRIFWSEYLTISTQKKHALTKSIHMQHKQIFCDFVS